MCLGPEYFNETGGTGYGDIDLEDWTNDTEDIDSLRTQCSVECDNRDYNNGADCYDGVWQIENYALMAVPDPGIDDPWHLNCPLPKANLAPLSPWNTTIAPTGSSPIWPSNSSAVSVDCTDFLTCADQFYAPIRTVLFYDDTSTLWDADMGFADYAAISSGSSTLEITILNPGATPSSDWYDADGRVEYSALDCGEAQCPFYLANLTLSNTSDTWELYSEDLEDMVYITDVVAQIRRPTLGVWKTSTDEFYLGEERIDMYITGTVQIGSGSPVAGAYFMTNVDAIFGQIGAGGTIEIIDFVADDGGNFEIEADFDADTVVGGPPTADHGLSNPTTAPSGAGLPISSIADVSSDPDNDIDSKYWFIDGTERATSYVIPTGSHTIELSVVDERGAFDLHKSTVVIVAP